VIEKRKESASVTLYELRDPQRVEKNRYGFLGFVGCSDPGRNVSKGASGRAKSAHAQRPSRQKKPEK